MVVFTCNHCGDSLQKPKVEKHYFTVCRNGKFLTCVDCFKDFKGEEYVAHIKCITEEERYAAKGSLPAEGVVKKGEVKQQSWTDLIQFIVKNNTNAPTGQRKIFEIISNSPNVPRKKNKFMNFIKSSCGNKVNLRDLEFIWDLIEKQKTEQDKSLESSKENKIDETEKKLEAEDDIGNQDKPKKSKKKSKSNESEITLVTGTSEPLSNSDVIENNGELNFSKKKKLKLGKIATELDNSENNERKSEIEVSNENNYTVLENGNKKKNKKSKHLKKLEESDVALETITADLETSIKNNENQATSNVSNQDLCKKKKVKRDEEMDSAVEQNKVNGIEINTEQDRKNLKTDKNSKKEATGNFEKKRKSDHVEEISENKISNGDSKLKKNKKIKKSKVEKSITTAEVNGTGDTKKKRKSETAEPENTKNESIEKKKIKVNDNEGSSIIEDDCVANETVDDSIVSNSFSYEKKIFEILKARNNISLQKLEKKVLSAYSKETGIEVTSKTIKKYNKKLKKVSGIEISENNVKLIVN